jgi:hypothetical protein
MHPRCSSRRHPGNRTGSLPALAIPLLALIALLASFQPASAVRLTLEPYIEAEQDLMQVTPCSDGTVGVLQMGQVSLLRLGGELVGRATAAPGERLYLSDAGGYVGVVRARQGGADFAPTESFELRNAAGHTLWRSGQTEDVSYAISAGGRVVGLSLNINAPERNLLHFYDERGAQISEVSVPHLLGGRFDSQGRVYLAHSALDGLRVFDLQGTEIARLPGARLFAVTPGGRTIVAVGDEGLALMRGGEIVARTSLRGLLARRIAIAPDGSRIAVVGRHELRVYDGADLALQWEATTADRELVFTSVDLAAEDGWLLAGVARDLGPDYTADQRHPAGEIRAYDARGRQLHVALMTFPIWNIWTPTALLDESGRTATITTRRAVYRTDLP